jgi:hypothetical protein
MNTVKSCFVALVAAITLYGCSGMGFGTPDLAKTLVSDLGVTPDQAMGGVGSMLNYAKGAMNPGTFDAVTKALPGSDKYMDAASKLLGAGDITNLAGLDSAFSNLGLSPSAVNDFKPVVSEYLGEQGGVQLGQAFSALFP